MPATADLHALGQSLWLDNITRDLLDDGTLERYIRDLSVTGLTSNPSIFQKAIAGSKSYESQIRELENAGLDTEQLFFELAMADLRRAADLFKPVHAATAGIDGWVSLEVSPLLANDTDSTIAQAKDLHARAARENLYIKVPGTPEGIPAIEELIFAGVPINVTLLFSREHYLAAAEAYTRGIERRLEAGLDPKVCSVASLFISRWDRAVGDSAGEALKDKLGLGPTRRTSTSARPIDGRRFVNAGRPRSDCSSPRPAPRTRPSPTPGTSPASRPPTPSTPCPRRPSSASTSTARWSRGRCPGTAGTRRRSSRPSVTPGSTSTPSRPSCRSTDGTPSTTPGTR